MIIQLTLLITFVVGMIIQEPVPAYIINKIEAENILGEPANLIDSSYSEEGTLTYRRAYQAQKTDLASGKTASFYYMFERFTEEEIAKRKYSHIKSGNEKKGIDELKTLGDEAYFYTDNINFYFIMVRKGSQVFSMKVNMITANTSLSELRKTAEKIAAEL